MGASALRQQGWPIRGTFKKGSRSLRQLFHDVKDIFLRLKLALIALASTATLAGCATAKDAYDSVITDGRSSNETFKAIGQEPGWTLEITPTRVEYVGDYGETKISGANVGVRTDANSATYINGRLKVTRVATACSDSMSGQRYRETVTVVADGKRLQGCGGGYLPPETLNGTNWNILSVNGKAALADVEANLSFNDGRVTGTAGCNRLMGSYSQSGDTLDFTQTASTRMACPAPHMEQERAVLSALQTGTKLHYNDDGVMELRAPNGDIIRLRQSF